MSLERYLGERKMRVLKRKVELSMVIQLKTPPHQVISKDQLRKQQKISNK